jgi:hypothetical protein
MIFADGLFQLSLPPALIEIIRIIVTVVGAIAGWFVFDPLTRVFYRLSFRGATPGFLLVSGKAAGAATVSLLIYFLLPLSFGGGSGGPGGPGGTGGPGNGDPSASNNRDNKAKPNPDPKTDSTSKTPPQLERVEIEIIGKKRFVRDGKNRFYLLKRAEPALSIDDLEPYLKEKSAAQGDPPKIRIVAVFTKESGSDTELADGPFDKLRKRAAKYNIKVDLSFED